MARSPKYPVMSISETLDALHRIEQRHGAEQIQRDEAARTLGYESADENGARRRLASLNAYYMTEMKGGNLMRLTAAGTGIAQAKEPEELAANLDKALDEAKGFSCLAKLPDNEQGNEHSVLEELKRNGFTAVGGGTAVLVYKKAKSEIEEIRTKGEGARCWKSRELVAAMLKTEERERSKAMRQEEQTGAEINDDEWLCMTVSSGTKIRIGVHGVLGTREIDMPDRNPRGAPGSHDRRLRSPDGRGQQERLGTVDAGDGEGEVDDDLVGTIKVGRADKSRNAMLT